MGNSQPKSPSALMQVIHTFVISIRLFFDSRVPIWVKIIPLAALAYIIFPFDFIPDFFPAVGQLDDLTILLIGLWTFMQLCPRNIVREYTGESGVVDGHYRVVKDDQPKTSSSTEQLPPPGSTTP